MLVTRLHSATTVMILVAIVRKPLTGYRQREASKWLGVSQTAIEIINGRWTMHIFGCVEMMRIGVADEYAQHLNAWVAWLSSSFVGNQRQRQNLWF